MDHWFATEHVSAHCKSTRRGNSQPPFQFLCSHPSTPRGYADYVCSVDSASTTIHPVRVCGYVGLIHPTPLHPSSTSSSAVSCAIGYIFMSKHFKVGPRQQFIHSSVDGHVYYIIIPILVHLHSIEGSDGTRTAVALIKVGHYYYY